MNKMMEKLLILVLVAATCTDASKMCAGDEDCADLGDVFCMKSRCDWGLCGCPRGQAMRFLGSEKKFQCVPIRRVGESCSTDGDKGVCGAANSECIDGKCICDHREDVGITRRWSYWGGELCEEQSRSVSGETCSSSLGPGQPGQPAPPFCIITGSIPSTCQGGNSWWAGAESPLDFVPNTCGCPDGYRVALENDFEDHAFTGNLIPTCVHIKFGELCLRDDDCRGTGALNSMKCSSNNRCECETAGYIPLFDGTFCAQGPALGHGATCRGTGYTSGNCDGSQGLICGDVCELTTFNIPTESEKCICDHSYATSGSSCVQATEDSSCDRDYQCKSLTRTGVCVEGLCKAGVAGMSVSLVLMLGLLVLNRMILASC